MSGSGGFSTVPLGGETESVELQDNPDKADATFEEILAYYRARADVVAPAAPSAPSAAPAPANEALPAGTPR